ncbi:unnamed protein product [Symbiodinium natans]|uniref:Uncharacterized protein n=1 Tax=Symbiodinium natans TaxID=878477 RepID=A0A812PRA0_9DINO|nr:unnamed protein product [Symbiodinium natans]
MANAKFCGLALLQLATFGDAQLVFMFPQRGGEIAQREQPAHVTVSKFSAMGSDGQMHTETHKVFTETSSDGLQKRMTEVDCKDGDCSKSVSHFFNGFPGMFSSMDFFLAPPSSLPCLLAGPEDVMSPSPLTFRGVIEARVEILVKTDSTSSAWRAGVVKDDQRKRKARAGG